MNAARRPRRGFTLIEMLSALLIFALLAAMAYRGLGAVLDARAQVGRESEKWLRISAFLERFERDAQMAAPRPVRSGPGTAAAWVGLAASVGGAVEFSRFGSAVDEPVRRLAYRLNEHREIELLVWPALDIAPGVAPARHVVLTGVNGFELRYYNAVAGWVDSWPPSTLDGAPPRAVRLRLKLADNEVIERVFSLKS